MLYLDTDRLGAIDLLEPLEPKTGRGTVTEDGEQVYRAQLLMPGCMIDRFTRFSAECRLNVIGGANVEVGLVRLGGRAIISAWSNRERGKAMATGVTVTTDKIEQALGAERHDDTGLLPVTWGQPAKLLTAGPNPDDTLRWRLAFHLPAFRADGKVNVDRMVHVMSEVRPDHLFGQDCNVTLGATWSRPERGGFGQAQINLQALAVQPASTTVPVRPRHPKGEEAVAS